MPPRGNKKPKDQNAPKRPQSSYFLFSNKRRSELKATTSEKKVTEISKIIAAEWNKMADEEKKPFENQAKELKAKYQTDIKKYKQSKNFSEYQAKLKSWEDTNEGGDTTTTGRRQKRLKDPKAPKKPQTGYFLFIGERRPKLKEINPGKKITEIAKLLGAEWKSMSASQKKPWEDKAKTLKTDYDKQFEKYKLTDDYKSFQNKLAQSKKLAKEKKKAESDSSSEDEEEKSKRKVSKPKGKGKKKESSSEHSDEDSGSASSSSSD